MTFTAPLENEVPVLIMGGGGAGLTASMLLARQGVEHLLVSARATTSDLPKAHVLNQRAMEVLDDVGVAEAIAKRGTPAEQMAATAFYAGLAGPDPDYGRRLARLESWGAGGDDEAGEPPCVAAGEPAADSPRTTDESSRGGALTGPDPFRPRAPRPRAGRRRRAGRDPGQRLRARIHGALRVPGRRRRRTARGRAHRRGIRRPRGCDATATLLVSADFSRLAKDPDVLIRWIYSPQAGVLAVLVPMGPERWGPDSELWVIHLNYPVDGANSDAEVEADARRALGTVTCRWRSTRSLAGPSTR